MLFLECPSRVRFHFVQRRNKSHQQWLNIYKNFSEASRRKLVYYLTLHHGNGYDKRQQSDLSLLKKGGFVVKSFSANPAIEDRVNAVNVLLLANRMAVHSKCKYLIKSLEQQAYGKNGKPEKMQGGVDDVSGPVDAAGYVISYLAPLRRYKAGGSSIRVW